MPSKLQEFKAGVFQALGHPTRVAIVESLRDGEISAGTIIERVSAQQASVSQHLKMLRAKGVVVSRKEGNQVYYSLRDPSIGDVLNIMKTYFQSQLQETVDLLHEIEQD